jgi:enoyl-CoA hydratase/carnithine racemase
VGAFVSTERRDAVALVTIDNPPVNALSAALLAELEAALEELDADDAVRAIVLAGGGERAFVAGADIKEFPALREDDDGGPARALVRVGLRIEAGRTPVIAAIRGFCLGGGLELALCCDLRVCADDARLGQPEIKLGLIPGAGGTQRLPRLAGIGRAMLLNLTGEPVDAATAERWGLVERVVAAEALLDEALALAGLIAEQSPHAVAVLKEIARTTRDLPLEEGLRREGDAFLRCIRHADGVEGVAAFLEKRPPRFGAGGDASAPE